MVYHSLKITLTALCNSVNNATLEPLPKLKCLWQRDNLNIIQSLSRGKTVMRVSIFPALWHLHCVPVIALRKQTGGEYQWSDLWWSRQAASLAVLTLKVSFSAESTPCTENNYKNMIPYAGIFFLHSLLFMSVGTFCTIIICFS